MISVTEKFQIDAPADEVWSLFTDPAVVASCIPGATLSKIGDDGACLGAMVIKFGPTTLTFSGEARIAYDNAARRCQIEGRGVDQKGMSRAVATGDVLVSGSGTAEVLVSGKYNFTGPLEGFARSGGVHIVRGLMSEFASNVNNLIIEQKKKRQSSPAEAVNPGADAAFTQPAHRPLSVIRLLGYALIGWLRQLFGKGDRNQDSP